MINNTSQLFDKTYSKADFDRDLRKGLNLKSKEEYYHTRGSQINNMLDDLNKISSDDGSMVTLIETHNSEVLALQEDHNKEVDEHLKSISSSKVAYKDLEYTKEYIEAFIQDDDSMDRFIQIIKNLIKENGDIPKDKEQEVINYCLNIVLPKSCNLIDEIVRKEFQKTIKSIDTLIDKCIIKDGIRNHYDTLGEIAVDYANMTTQERYLDRREAFRDAVGRRITYTSKFGKKEPLKKWKQLDRAYNRVKDLSK
jgi:hypothetical protein